MKVNEIIIAIRLILRHPNSIAWNEFRDRGNPCVDWDRLQAAELNEIALTRGLIQAIMPKHSNLFMQAQRVISAEMGTAYISYDWCTKALGRVLSGVSLQEFFNTLVLAFVTQQTNCYNNAISAT